MTRTLSCGELKQTRFVKGPDGILTKADPKTKDSDTVQLQGGARILKVENKEQVNELLTNNIDPKNSKESLKEFLRSREFDGISIDKKTLATLDDSVAKDLFDSKYGVRVVNDEIFRNTNEDKSYRTGFKADATEITKRSKEVFSDVYNEINRNRSLDPVFNRHQIQDYHIANIGGEYTFNGYDVTEEIENLKNIVNKNSKKISLVGGKGSARVLPNGSIEMSIGDTLRIKNIYTSIYNKNITDEDLVDCLALYAQGLQKSNFSTYKNVSKKLENLTKQVQPKLENDEYGKPVTSYYIEDHNAILDISKEALHKEKVAWNHAISNSTPEQREVFEAIAKIKFRSDMENHLNNINSREGSYTLGDLNLNYFNPNVPNASFKDKIRNRVQRNVNEAVHHAVNAKRTTEDIAYNIKTTSQKSVQKASEAGSKFAKNVVSKTFNFGSRIKTNVFNFGSSTKNKVCDKISTTLIKMAGKISPTTVPTTE